MASEFGICSWTLGSEDPNDIMKQIAELGLDGLQFHGDHRTHCARDVAIAARAHGLKIYAIDPANSGPVEGDIASAENGIAYFKQVIAFAKDAGSDTVTVHGLGTWIANCADRTGAFQRLVSALQVLCDHASIHGVRLLWEPCNRYEMPMVRSTAEGRRLHNSVNRPNFGLILDSFHMNIEDRCPVDEIKASGDRIAIYHVSDSNRGGIGVGHVDFKAHHDALASVGFHGPIMLEFVLPHLCPHTPPSSSGDRREFAKQCHDSLDIGRSFAQH